MKRIDYKRGDFILSRLQYYLLVDLGRGEIDAEQAGYIFDLMVWAKKNNRLYSNGVTTEEDLASHPYYLRALDDYRRYLELKQQRLEEKFA